MTDSLPWDDEERWPALLKRIESVAGGLLVEVERERRIWRAHQPALRRDPCLKLPGERHFNRVARHLERVRDDAQWALEDQ
jgi:hypothetical protein